MAYWINVYNFLTVDLIIREKETDSIKNLGGFFSSPWKKHKWILHDKSYTLDQIEHKILRKMNEPRIHMAINCASLSCPDLLTEAYRANQIESQLEKQTLLFLQDSTKGMQIQGRNLKLSKLFDWFAEDFGNKQKLILFLQKYSQEIKFDSVVEGYLKYDWKLNSK